MELTEQDLRAVRRVLQGKTTREHAAEHYSTRHKALLAAAILMGAGLHRDSSRLSGIQGIYGGTLYKLVADLGPTIEHSSLDRDPLTQFLRRHGLHKSNRNGTTIQFIGHPQLETLLQETSLYEERCCTWFNQTYEMVKARILADRDARRKYEIRKAALRRIAKKYGFYGLHLLTRQEIWSLRGDLTRYKKGKIARQKINDYDCLRLENLEREDFIALIDDLDQHLKSYPASQP